MAKRYQNTKPVPLHVDSPLCQRNREEIQWPELTDQHLLKVFLSSDITIANVVTLRTLLNLPYKAYPELFISNAPYCAMGTVKEWMDNDPLSLENTHKLLATQLERIGLGCLIPQLQGKERYTAIDPRNIKSYLASQSRHFSVKQARVFGTRLESYLGGIRINQMKAERGMDLVLEIFDHINRSYENLEALHILKIFEAIHEAEGWINKAPKTSERTTQLGRPINAHELETDGNIPIHLGPVEANNDQPQGVNEANPLIIQDQGHIIEENDGTRPVNSTKQAIYIRNAILILVIAVIILYITAVVCLLHIPSFSQIVSKQMIIPNDAVLFKIPFSNWLTHISIELQGPFITGCHAEVISIKCENASQNTNTSIISGNGLNYLYIEKEGTVKFMFNSSQHFTNPYYAWIFTTFQSAMSNSSNNFKNLACGNTPDNVHCVDLSEMKDFVLPESRYYFIRCNNRDHNCTQVDISINSSRYDFESSKRFQIDFVSIHTQRTEESIKVRPDFNLDDPICLLMELSSECRDANPSIYQVAILRMTRRLDFSLFYPSISFLIIISIIASIIICIILGKWLYRRSQKPNNNANQQGHCDDSEHACLTQNEEIELTDFTTPPPNDDNISESSTI